MEQVEVYSTGLVSCSVCAEKDISQEDLEHLVNKKNPTGISSQWKISKENFSDGSINPKVCERGRSRLHYLLHC